MELLRIGGRSDLHGAARQGDIENVQNLLQEGAHPNVKDSMGSTPLHYAARNGHADIVRLLIEYGADNSIANLHGDLARDLAQLNGSLDLSVFESAHTDHYFLLPNARRDPNQDRQELPVLEERCIQICEAFEARVEINSPGRDHRTSITVPIHDLLYAENRDDWRGILRGWRSSLGGEIGSPEHVAIRWVHLPANNILWVKDMIKRICHSDHETKEKCESILSFVNESLYGHTDSTLHACYREPSWKDKDDKTSLVLPYLDMESEQYLNRKLRPQTKHVTSMYNLIEQYEEESNMYASLTLDQSYYDVMEDTEDRDHDQVVYRYTKEKDPGNVRLLMVSQLWIWTIDKNTIITSCPERWHEGAEITMLDAILDERPDIISNATDLVQHIVKRCINFTEEPNKAGLGERYAKTFARAVVSASIKEASYYASVTKAISAGVANAMSIGEDIGLLQETKDIRDELNMLRHVLRDQINMVAICKYLQWAQFDLEFNTNELEMRLRKIERMDEDAERVEKSLYHLLDLKQKQSNVEEAKLARRQAEDTVLQGKYLFVFTVVTVIFTPLSFMAALFAISIKEFPHDDNGLSFDGRWIGKYMAAGEFTTLGAVLFITLAVLNFPKNPEDPGWFLLQYFRKWQTSARTENLDNHIGRREHPQNPADTDAPPQRTWLQAMKFWMRSGSGAFAPVQQNANGANA